MGVEKRRNQKPQRSEISCVDLFCGVGGLTHGLTQEGISVNAGIDIDSACRYPYEANNDSLFLEADISEIGVGDLAPYLPHDSIRVLAGCAPCQPFSTYSQRYDSMSDGKWGLLYEFGRLTHDLGPDIVTMENVPSVERHVVFRDFVEQLEALGYWVWSRVVDCSAYGVPQTRRRMVLLASRYGPIELIAPTHRKPRTVRQAIEGLPPIEAGATDRQDPLHTAASLSAKNLARIRASRPGGSWNDWPQHLVADCHRTESGRTYPSVYGRMEWDKPAPTMTTQCYGFGNGRFGHPEQDRAISLREAAILQSFPRRYRFVAPGSTVQFSTIGRLIGNAVPVRLGRIIGRSIVRHVEQIRAEPIRKGTSKRSGIGRSRTDVR